MRQKKEWVRVLDEAKRLKIDQFMKSELEKMRANILENYPDNVENRKNNPFLPFEHVEIKKYMALGRSVDSQLGNRMQRIIFYLARLRYGILNVPNIVTIDILDEETRQMECVLYCVDSEIAATEYNRNFDPFKQDVYIDKAFSEQEIKSRLKLKARSTALQSRRETFFVTEESFTYIKSKQEKRIPVDLLVFDGTETGLNRADAFEIKMGGKLDTKNAESNAKEVKSLASLFGFLEGSNAYFATCYGECSLAVKSEVEKQLGEGNILNGKAFWEKVLPEDFAYEQFIEMFTSCFINSGLETALQEL